MNRFVKWIFITTIVLYLGYWGLAYVIAKYLYWNR